MNERDVLGSQLVRRNDEIALLNEKIVILQSTLARGIKTAVKYLLNKYAKKTIHLPASVVYIYRLLANIQFY